MLTLDCNQNIIFHWTRCLAQQKKTGSFYGTKTTSLQVKGGSSWTWDSLLFFYTYIKKPQLWSSFLLFAPIIPCSIGSKLFNRLHTHAQYDTVQRGKLRDSEYREKVKCVHECCTAKLYSFFFKLSRSQFLLCSLERVFHVQRAELQLQSLLNKSRARHIR